MRTLKIQGSDLKSRIDACQKDCASLKDKFYGRLHLDTNIQVKEIKVDLQHAGTSFFFFLVDIFSSDNFTVGIGRMLNAIKDEKLGAFELHSSI